MASTTQLCGAVNVIWSLGLKLSHWTMLVLAMTYYELTNKAFEKRTPDWFGEKFVRPIQSHDLRPFHTCEKARPITNECCFDGEQETIDRLLLIIIINIIKLRWALFVTYTIIQSNHQWNVFSAFNPSKCTHTWSSGHWAADTAAPGGAVGGSVPCSRVSPQSWTIPAGAEIRTHNLGLQVRRSIH